MDLYQWQQRFEAWLSEHHSQGDAAHDISHFRRVWATAQRLAEESDADRLVILTACYFHDIVSLAKNHPERSRSSAMAAEQTLTILQSDFPAFPPERYAAVLHAIEAHSFSAGMAPRSEEAKIVQDADRQRDRRHQTRYCSAHRIPRIRAPGQSPPKPPADRRELDDKKYALDHFQCKLLRLPETMQTEKGRAMALHNARFLVQYMAKLSAELRGDPMSLDDKVLQRFDPLA